MECCASAQPTLPGESTQSTSTPFDEDLGMQHPSRKSGLIL